jgi:hypothetical protein
MLNANTNTVRKCIVRDNVTKDWNAYLNDEYIGTFKYSFQAEAELDRLAYEQLRRSAPQGVEYAEPEPLAVAIEAASSAAQPTKQNDDVLVGPDAAASARRYARYGTPATARRRPLV